MSPEARARKKARDRARASRPEIRERLKAQARARYALRDRLNQAPPVEPVPEGFEVRELTTVLGPDGAVRTQSARARPEGASAELVSTQPEGHAVRGVSTLVSGDGRVLVQWVKTSAEDRRAQAWLDALPALLEPLRGSVPIVYPPRPESDDLAVYVIGDAHIGMLAWEPETGVAWDVKRAEAMITAGADRLFAATPRTRKALVVNVGDFQHADSPSNRTPEGGAILDVDGRDAKVRRAVLRTIRYYLDAALTKHAEVELVNQPGNHDPYATCWLGLALEALYEREPRIKIDTSPAEHRVVEHGKCLIGVTHKPKQAEDLGHLLAARWPEAWGRTTYRIWLCGHVHHQTVRERAGFAVETFGTLAPGDAWHVRQGYMARRRMVAIVLDPLHGEVGRHTVHATQLTSEEP
ncbi:MAG: hypothetical protein A2Y78_00090 [Acidobacteria bacterium RBG_13_68_16]|nr:MAG: hypothetical protein A2Y78_00090 [Acidobacteria bacterium RBG_13_68_16]